MSLRRFGNLLVVLGLVTAGLAYAWWDSFYSQARDLIDAKHNLTVEYLYQMIGSCRIPVALAKNLGRPGYEPMLFWV